MRAGPWETVLKIPYRHLGESLKVPPSPTSQSGYNGCSASLSAPERSQGAPQPLLAPLWFELPDFALEIIDAGVRNRQLTLKIFHLPAELLMHRIQLLMPRIQIFVVGFKVAQAFTDAFHPLCEVIRYVLLGHSVTSLSCAPCWDASTSFNCQESISHTTY